MAATSALQHSGAAHQLSTTLQGDMPMHSPFDGRHLQSRYERAARSGSSRLNLLLGQHILLLEQQGLCLHMAGLYKDDCRVPNLHHSG